MDFESFTGSPRVEFTSNNPAQPSALNGLELGEIDSLYGNMNKYRADIRLFNGQFLEKVRLPGPAMSITGFLSGLKNRYKTGQMVLVGFLQNRRDNPIVVQVYPFAADTLGRNSLTAHTTQYETDETAIGDGQGNRTAWTDNKVEFLDKLFQSFLEIDYTEKKITLKVDPTTKIEMSLGQIKITSPQLKASNGILEFDIHTHQHATAVPGPPIKPTPGT